MLETERRQRTANDETTAFGLAMSGNDAFYGAHGM